MIDERIEEQASLYALGVLEANEKAAFEEKIAGDGELQRLVDDLTAAAANIAHSAPPRLPPPHLEAAILQQIRRAGKTSPPLRLERLIPWALAASLALSTALLLFNREKMVHQVTELEAKREQTTAEAATLLTERNRAQGAIAELERRETEARTQIASLGSERERLEKELTRLQERDSFSQMQIATLSSKLAEAPRATAFVIWDAKQQRGILTAVDVPPNAADHDYQLWVVDPKYQIPVDAGVFTVDKNGVAKIPFKPKLPVTSASAFAVSLERKGGVPKAEGPMVLVGK
ncbi:MAG: hypothetical protein DLM73_06690 [Chthoniobacterales bacterium]|nr:MAG: hypothetical protein DLM73_06690 [Chthoniobacterales bacterium]